MTRALLPGLFENETFLFRPFFNEIRNCATPCSRSECSEIGLYEDDDFVTVEAPVPGLKAEEIKVDLKEGVLYIQGEKKEEKKEGKIHQQWTSNYSYSILLPQPIDEKGKIEAETKDGILTIRLPKSRASKPIKISVSGT